MRRIWMMVLACALTIGVGVALAQSNPSTNAGSAQGQVSGSASGQTGNNAGTQPPATDNAQRPQSPPAGSNAQAAQTSPTGPGNTQNTKSERGAGGVSVVWLLIGIVVVAAVLYFIARGGGMDRDAHAAHMRRADEIDRESNDRNRAA